MISCLDGRKIIDLHPNPRTLSACAKNISKCLNLLKQNKVFNSYLENTIRLSYFRR